jgi:hypothetical protein
MMALLAETCSEILQKQNCFVIKVMLDWTVMD